MSTEKPFAISYNQKVAEVLTSLRCTLAISTYQAGKVIFLGSDNGRTLFQIPVGFRKPMGIALLNKKMAVATIDEIQIYGASRSIGNQLSGIDGSYDKLYLPRATYYSGGLDLHDVGFGKGGLWAVNTRFSCIATFDINNSFTPRWKPTFITELKPQDRCHLNGMAMVDQKPAYVSALSQTNTPAGWREDITNSGVLMTVPNGEMILENLPMPHSPRIIDGKLYLLLSASGELVRVDVENKSYETVVKVNGFIRGMAAHKNYVFIGLSKVRKSSKTFGKLPVSEMADHAGVLVYDLLNNEKIGMIKYNSTVEEIYDVQILPDTAKPGLISVSDERHSSAIVIDEKVFVNKTKKT